MNSATNPIKIAFVGTSCVGKTSLYDHYKQKYKQDSRVAFVKEAAREYFTKNPEIPIDQRFSVIPQSEVQQLVLQMEQIAHNSGVEVIICDRSVLDAVAYVCGHGDKEGSKMLLEKVRLWLPTYHRVFLLDPADIPYQTDNIRKETPDVRERNHQVFLEVLMEANVAYELLSGTQSERIQRVDEIIQFL